MHIEQLRPHNVDDCTAATGSIMRNGMSVLLGAALAMGAVAIYAAATLLLMQTVERLNTVTDDQGTAYMPTNLKTNGHISNHTCAPATVERHFVHGPTMVKLLPHFVSAADADHLRELGDDLLATIMKKGGSGDRRVAMFRGKKWGEVSEPAELASSAEICRGALQTN